MSLDLDWSLLADDESLSTHFKTVLNRALSSAKRPDFIGPIEITHLDLGHQGLDIEVTKIGDLWKDFVEIDRPPIPNPNPSQSNPIRQNDTEGSQFQHHHHHHSHPQESQSRRNRKNSSKGRRDRNGREQEEELGDDLVEEDGGVDRFMNRNLPVPQTNRLQTLRQYDSEVDAQMIGGGTISGTNTTITGSGNGNGNGGGSGSLHQNQGYRPWSAGLRTNSFSTGAGGGGGGIQPPWNGYYNGGIGTPMSNGNGGYFSHWQPQPPPPAPATRQGSFAASRLGSNHPNSPPTNWGGADNHLGSNDTSSSASSLPSLQIHASLTWPTTSLRLTLSTSLLINYPSPMFMSLPLQITATGFILQAGLILAIEGEKKRIHISLLPDEDEVPMEGQINGKDLNQTSTNHLEDHTAKVVRSSKPPPSISGSTTIGNELKTSNSNSEIPSEKPTPGLYSRQNSNNPSSSAYGYSNDVRSHSIGARLLPSMTFESSVGQADKHTLRNVGKVEKFVLDLVRKGIEDELVFPSFYTVNLPR